MTARHPQEPKDEKDDSGRVGFVVRPSRRLKNRSPLHSLGPVLEVRENGGVSCRVKVKSHDTGCGTHTDPGHSGA